jgi:type IV pilus assembly protein PilA
MDNKKGFTLIELLIVVVIIGILAAIAIPRFGETRERAFRSAMTSDLRNVQTLQEQFYFDAGEEGTSNYTYASDVASLNFNPSDGVAIEITGADADGYVATADHDATSVSCTLTVGDDDGDDGIVCTDG